MAAEQQRRRRGGEVVDEVENEEVDEVENEVETEEDGHPEWLRQLRQRMLQRQADEGTVNPVGEQQLSPFSESTSSSTSTSSPSASSSQRSAFTTLGGSPSLSSSIGGMRGIGGGGQQHIGVADDVLAEDHVAEEKRAMSEEQDMR
jgi:hypothetical protein